MDIKDIIVSLAKYKLKWGVTVRKRFTEYTGKTLGRSTDDEIYEFATKFLPSIPEDDDEIIKRDDWSIPDQFGEIENSLMSPHKWSFFDYICKNPRSKKKVLTVLECSNSKPYCQDASKRWYFHRFRSFTDFACGAYGIVPEEYSMLYPVREDEWAHNKESDSVAFKYNLVSCNRGYQYLKAMDYDHIIVFFQNPAPEEFMKWMVNMPDMKDKIHFVVTPELLDEALSAYPKFTPNFLKTRLLGLPHTKKKYMDVLKSCLGGDDLSRFEKIEKLIEEQDVNGQRKWIKKTNKEQGIEQYNIVKPNFPKMIAEESYMHSKVSDLDSNIVNEYKEWLREWNMREVSDGEIRREDRLIFTPLDLLIDKYNLNEHNPCMVEIDKLYWCMREAIYQVKDEIGVEELDGGEYGRHSYIWVYKKLYDQYTISQLKRECDRMGLSQYHNKIPF